ncbi:MAG: transposase [Desulfobulbaceae bacterium]|nr:transposase [Desulfobulbaceae bacterium]MDW7646510.1 transposase [Desulfuromonadales bacterium]
MIYTKDHKTLNMFEPFAHLGPKRLKLMEQSWAKLFRDDILPVLPVHKVARHYDPLKGRPTKELYAMLGAMILQEMHDLTDLEAVQQFAFNIQWHYALNITADADRDAYLCPKTLWNMRSLLTREGHYSSLFDSVTDKLREVFDVDTDRQRLDSVHIFSNMRHLSRIGLFAQTIKTFLVNLKRHHRPLFDGLEDELKDRYLFKQGESVFAMVKPSESARTLQTIGTDLFVLIERFRAEETVTGMHSYQLLVRLFREQCCVEEATTGHTPKVSVKPNKEVPSDSLQNPSDPDASYDGHKGRGYQVQIMETYSREKNGDQLNLITHVHAEAAHHNDVHALLPAVEQTKQQQRGPKEVLADSLYGSDENCGKAAKEGVEVIAPAGGKNQPEGLGLADFTYSEKGRATACPQSHAPLKTKYKKDRHSAAFDPEICALCPHLSECPAKPGRKGHYLRYSNKELRLARRRAHEKTPEFRDRYRFRAGVEATMSEYDRKTGVKQLRVRGLGAVRYCATLKATGLNIFRATAFRKRQTKAKDPEKKASSNKLTVFLGRPRVVEGQISVFLTHIAGWAGKFQCAAY